VIAILGPEASTHGMGQGESGQGLRTGAVPARDPAAAPDRAACRDHGGGRVLQGVRVRLTGAGNARGTRHAARVDVVGLVELLRLNLENSSGLEKLR